MKGKKVIVTGGAGFIGSHLVESLVREGAEVVVIDNLSTGDKANLDSVRDEIKLIECDVTSSEYEDSFEGIDTVFHLAAVSSVSRSVEDPIGTHEINVNGTLKVLEAAKKAGVKRIVYVSSAAVYGSSPKMPILESEPLSPESPYALHKMIGENYSSLYSKLFKIETIVIRPFNVYGPRQKSDSPYSGVISIFADNAKNVKVITIKGDGKQTRDFVFVGDAVKAMVLAGKKEGLSGKIFNVGTGKHISINELAEIIKKAAGNNIEIKHINARIGDVRSSVSDISQAKKLLGWEPKVSLEEGLKHLL